jgi:NADH:ubiquinone reductase (H+-translocating)
MNSKVVIIGAGFGGLEVARKLENVPVQATLIDKNNYHLFQALIYQVATAAISPNEIAHPVRAILNGQKNYDFLLAEAQKIDLENRKVITSQGEVSYDYLVLAPGGQTFFFGNQKLAEHAFGLKTMPDAVALRNHILNQFELASREADPQKRKALLTFVIVGGGPTGVEYAGALKELVKHGLKKDFSKLDFSEVSIILLEASTKLLPAMPAELSEETHRALTRKGVDVRFGAMVTDYDGQQVTLKDGTVIHTETLVWAAGIRAVSFLDGLGLPQDRLGRLKVTDHLQVEGHPEIYVVGDAACALDEQGNALPMVAPVAIQEGEYVVNSIQAQLEGRQIQPFVYHSPGLLATIGRNDAVAQLWGINFKGFMAWLIWLFVHLIRLIGFRNKLLVLVNWAWDYIFTDRAIRLIGFE